MGLLTSEISTKQMVTLCRQLATTYEAGIPLAQAMDVVGAQMKDRDVKQVLSSIRSDIQGGTTLGEAAANQQRHLPTFFVQLAAVGETGGRLDSMFRDLADYYEDKAALNRRVIGSMIYPSIQLILAWFLGSFALTTIGMIGANATSFSFGALFARYTELQIAAGIVAGFVIAAMIVMSRLGVLRYVTGFVSTFVWPLSGVTQRFALARFCRSMSLLVGSGVAIPKCIEGGALVASNPYIQKDLLLAVPPIKSGHTLTEAFSTSRYMPRMVHEMIAVGEETGALEIQLQKASKWLTEEAESRVNVLIKLMNAGIVLAVGAVVGYIVISFYSRLYGGLLNDIGV